MSDNIKTKDRLDADLDISAKDMGGGVQLPRNILTDPDGNDLTPLEEGGTVGLDAATLAALEPPPAIAGFATAANQTSGDQVTRLSGSAAQAALGIVAKAEPFGGLQVSGSLTPLLSDPFDAALDTRDRWSVSGTTLPSASSGSVVASLGASNSVSSVLVSQPVFTPVGQPHLLAGQLAVGAQQTNPNAHRWFGPGLATSFTAATPMTNGHGFEVDVTGALNAVVYVSGVRYVVNSTNPALITAPGSWAANMVMTNYGATLTWPASGVAIVSVRYFNGYAYFYMAGGATGLDIPIGLASWVPAATALPIRLASITTPAVSTVLATTFAMSGLILGAVGGTNFTSSDPAYPWRQGAIAVTKPLSNDGAQVVQQAPSDIFRSSFADEYTGAVAPEFSLLQTGTGMAVNQTGGNLVITSGTTANSETVIRSVKTFRGSMSMRFKSILSQRIVNNNFIIELADLVGTALAYTINSATSVTVTFPTTNPFTSANVSQAMNLGVITGAAGLPGRYAIASVSGLTVTFTVASWPASGSGTLTLYGWNYIRANYNNVTATNVGFDTQRRGRNSGDSTLTTQTSASPGHMVAIQTDNTFVDLSDSLVASAAAPAFTARGSRMENIPDDNIDLYLFIRVFNGTTNPATTTTWTVGLVQVEQTGNQKVYMAGALSTAGNRAIPITGPVSGTVAISSVIPGVAATNLGKAEDAVAASGDTGVFVLAVRRDTLTTSSSATGDYNEVAVDQYGAALTRDYEKHARTYSCAVNVAAAAAATDIATITGSATTTVYITNVIISGIQTTAGLNDVLLIKRSTANTGGTSTGGVEIPHDSADAAATATVLAYTANPTVGTPVGEIRRNYLPIAGVTSVVNPVVVYDFGERGRPIILRGIAQVLAVNLNGATITGGTFDVSFEWFEI